ncbi:MAG: phosphate signaling complex protein PhoU [Spirochaetia bacterium]|nr:phosphate signaling complex protein PhoU [Spirochaetia bacterium]
MTKQVYQIDEKIMFYRELLLQMVTRVEQAILKATIAMENKDIKLAESVINEDFFINQLRDMIESDAVRLLISEAPYGHYMRQVIAGLKIATSLERMGDHATHLAKMVSHENFCNDEREQPIIKGIIEMSNIVANMFREAINALINIDAKQAKDVAKMDDEIDKRREDLKKQILEAGPFENIQLRQNMHNYYYLVIELERVGDHITTICSWVVYMDEGVKPHL